MRILADNDVVGALRVLQRIVEQESWDGLAPLLDLEFIEFEAIGLSHDASDREVWIASQAADAILLTGNRVGGGESMELAIRELTEADSLPVLTLSNPQRVFHDRLYAEECAFSLLDNCERIDSLRGTGRLFLP